jgi:hypothetical protein
MASTSTCTISQAGSSTCPWRSLLSTLLATGRKTDTQSPAVTQQAAEKLASELFFKPLLEEMRNFPLKGELADGGQTESIFGEQLDERFADTVAGTARSLVQNIVKQIQKLPSAGGGQVTWPALTATTSTESTKEQTA